MTEPQSTPDEHGAADVVATDATTPPEVRTPEAKPGAADPKPKTRKRAPAKRAAAKKGSTRRAAAKPTATASAVPEAKPPTVTQLRTQRANAAAELLCLPAIPATFANQPYLVEHFTTVGPITARRLAELAEQSPEIARVMDKASQGNVFLGLVMVALGYAGPVLLHLTGRTEAAQGATMAVQLMEASPGTLAAMFQAVAETEEMPGDDDGSAVPPQHPPAAGEAPAV